MSPHADFAAGLLRPAVPAPAHIAGHDVQAREHRYAVHRNNCTHALIDAFQAGYPVSRALLGEACFAHAARECARAQPPRTPVLAEYVQVFPRFLAGTPLVADVPYLADVARLEAACLRVYHAADAAPVPVSAWQALLADPQRLAAASVRLHPAMAWLACTHAAVDIWQAHVQAEHLQLAELDGIDVTIAQDALLWRGDDGLPRMAAMPTGSAAALDALQAGASLLVALAPLPGAASASVLTHLAGSGLVAGILEARPEAT